MRVLEKMVAIVGKDKKTISGWWLEIFTPSLPQYYPQRYLWDFLQAVFPFFYSLSPAMVSLVMCSLKVFFINRLEIMESMALYQETGYEKLYRWTQGRSVM